METVGRERGREKEREKASSFKPFSDTLLAPSKKSFHRLHPFLLLVHFYSPFFLLFLSPSLSLSYFIFLKLTERKRLKIEKNMEREREREREKESETKREEGRRANSFTSTFITSSITDSSWIVIEEHLPLGIISRKEFLPGIV